MRTNLQTVVCTTKSAQKSDNRLILLIHITGSARQESTVTAWPNSWVDCVSQQILYDSLLMFRGALPLFLLASERQCIDKSASVIWEMRGTFRNSQLQNIIKGLKINLKYKLQNQLNALYLRYKARNQTVTFDTDYLLQIGTERKTDQIMLKTI